MTDNDESQKMDGALKGVRVLDLSEYVSGAYCAKLLGAFGADVIKIEKPDHGDPARSVGPFLNDQPHPERSALFLYLNTNKKGITLNLGDQAGAKILNELIKDADVLVENFQPGFLSSLGLGYDDLENINPRLVMVSITDFGQTGPYRDYKGDRLVGNALSGYMYINGEPDQEPLAGGGEQPAYQGGVHGYIGVMAALLARETTGSGQYIDISQMECLASLHQFNVNRYEYSKMVQKRVGNRYAYSHPITIYPCKDGEVSICPANEDQAERMLLLMEMSHLLEDPRFETGFHRLANADAFDELVKPWFLERGRKEIVESCQDFRVPASYVNTVEDLLNDEQFVARDYWIEIDHPEAGMLPYASCPFKMSETPAQPERAPLLGEHNEEIFCTKLGMSREDLVRLRQGGVI
jgi:crotonobetainyl-CoA:carnitine CoA-transferase CaiB-like acyl-CoA transferase